MGHELRNVIGPLEAMLGNVLGDFEYDFDVATNVMVDLFLVEEIVHRPLYVSSGT